MNRIKVSHKSKGGKYEIVVGGVELGDCGTWAHQCLGETVRKAMIVSNAKVFSLYGGIVETSLRRSGLDVSIWLMKDGERHKDLTSLKALLSDLSNNGVSRDDVIIALGGGVVGDLAGFAAAVYLRGVRFLQVPTTLLAMIDSSVGGKTGINTDFGKNLVGAFHRPSGVLIDVGTLSTLPTRELTAGFCEAIKQGALAGQKLFRQIRDYLADLPPGQVQPDQARLEPLIFNQIAFKASIIKQDEIEETARVDDRSRKILNFGHTFAHALEKVTNYRRLRHGEAVGYGIMFAAELSKNIDLLH